MTPFLCKRCGITLTACSCAMAYSGHPDQCYGPTTFAQHGDDLMLLNLFDLIGVVEMSYLDLGAHHPTTISNTRLLYEHGWRGVNVEANPALMPAFVRDRPEDTNINTGVALHDGFSDFYMYDETSGLNTFSPAEAQRFASDLSLAQIVSLPVTTLDDIIAGHCPGRRYPSLLLSDIEGLDFDVLASANFPRFGYPLVICVETRRDSGQQMRSMLQQRQYFQYCRMQGNAIFVQERFRRLVY